MHKAYIRGIASYGDDPEAVYIGPFLRRGIPVLRSCERPRNAASSQASAPRDVVLRPRLLSLAPVSQRLGASDQTLLCHREACIRKKLSVDAFHLQACLPNKFENCSRDNASRASEEKSLLPNAGGQLGHWSARFVRQSDSRKRWELCSHLADPVSPL